ncbi:hypothetical protein [Glycomyces buryatensis]|uniref:Uncharacterized protein n=1 Tax=Glycomyces buryatensis TaxID=2570927 RepID=A0A4S8QEP8_9ACTN|nr:hypothetical protein [Glycomyces buryatensis]THV41385.1 hypothetical protein FAB82_12000 [Glycomyces buryatensis]
MAENDRPGREVDASGAKGVQIGDNNLQINVYASAHPKARFANRHDLATVLHQGSRARREVRLQAFEVDEAVLAPYLGQIKIPDIPSGRVKVLLGDFGSGKSEIAETWHRAEIENLIADERAPLPVWLNAQDLLGRTLEGAVEQQLGPTWRHGQGASITVDGLDETNDPAKAQALLDAARILSKTYTNIRVLLTARPGILSAMPTEGISATLLSEDAALKLVESVSGRPYSTWRWTTDMRATVTRPFFALGAGVMLRQDGAPRGEADLIRDLVENALRKGTERSAVTSSEILPVLQKLAVVLTRTGKDDLLFSDRQIARSSRLVADGPDDSVRFALPIFQHWFAAQTILTGDVSAAEVVADTRRFNRWRWAAAVAALSARTEDAVDDLLGTWVAGNPGAAAWIINEAFNGHRDWRTEDDENLDAQTSGTRLLQALRTWTEGLGPLAGGVLPSLVVRGPVGLGVTVSGHRIDIAFSTSRPAADYVTQVPLGVHPLVPSPVPDWRPWISGEAPEGHAWPWTMVQKSIASAMDEKLSRDPFLGTPDGVWVQERRFDLARRVLGRGSGFHGDLSADEIRNRATELFNAIGQNRDAGISRNGSAIFSGAELDDLVSWIDSTAPGQVVSHLPEADVSHPGGGWVWDRYSPQRLMEFEVEVYGRACEAYDEALAHSFARLGWSMPSSALAPFGVVLEVQFDGPDRLGNVPLLTAMQVPMALIRQFAPPGPEAVWSVSRRAVIAQTSREQSTFWERQTAIRENIRSWLAGQSRESIGSLGWVDTGADDMSNGRPASSLAAGWLSDDLKSLGLGTGGSPQLR